MIRAATLSEDGRYRYDLYRRWGPRYPTATWVMLNPSTADATKEDRTLNRCIAFSRSWGYDALHVVNLWALRSPKPAALLDAVDPVGPDNDEAIQAAVEDAALVVVGWGAWVEQVRRTRRWPLLRRVADVVDILAHHGPPPHAVGLTAAGHPRHPLYVPGTARPVPWQPVT